MGSLQLHEIGIAFAGLCLAFALYFFLVLVNVPFLQKRWLSFIVLGISLPITLLTGAFVVIQILSPPPVDRLPTQCPPTSINCVRIGEASHRDTGLTVPPIATNETEFCDWCKVGFVTCRAAIGYHQSRG